MGYFIPVTVCLCLYVRITDCSYYNNDWRAHWRYSGNWPSRIYSFMQERYEDASRKVEFLHEIRFTYEESPQYEMGYVMGEIMARYKKLVENLKRGFMFKNDAIGVTIKRLHYVMVMYFEIYHLVKMMHEIPKKYGLTNDMQAQNLTAAVEKVAFDNNKRAKDAQDKLERDKKMRANKRKKWLKEMKKMRELMLKGQYKTERTKKPQNKWWPIDYGWEIDYYW